MMRLTLACSALAVVSLAVLAPAQCLAQSQSRKIDLQTAEGVASVHGQWRFANARIVDFEGKTPTGEPDMTYNIEPHAEAPDFDDSSWDVVDPARLHERRGKNHVAFGWYRIKVTLPEGVEGKQVHFSTTVDDYGEVWVDGQLPYKVGQNGGAIVAGFNAPNRVPLPDPQPGKTYSIAIFAINGPISKAPGNWLFLRNTHIEIAD
jgi:hypothetical protein